MLFQLILEKSQTSRDAYSEAICYINVIATLTLNPYCVYAAANCAVLHGVIPEIKTKQNKTLTDHWLDGQENILFGSHIFTWGVVFLALQLEKHQ